jgi:hypothetical protein
MIGVGCGPLALGAVGSTAIVVAIGASAWVGSSGGGFVGFGSSGTSGTSGTSSVGSGSSVAIGCSATGGSAWQAEMTKINKKKRMGNVCLLISLPLCSKKIFSIVIINSIYGPR